MTTDTVLERIISEIQTTMEGGHMVKERHGPRVDKEAPARRRPRMTPRAWRLLAVGFGAMFVSGQLVTVAPSPNATRDFWVFTLTTAGAALACLAMAEHWASRRL